MTQISAQGLLKHFSTYEAITHIPGVDLNTPEDEMADALTEAKQELLARQAEFEHYEGEHEKARSRYAALQDLCKTATERIEIATHDVAAGRLSLAELVKLKTEAEAAQEVLKTLGPAVEEFRASKELARTVVREHRTDLAKLEKEEKWIAVRRKLPLKELAAWLKDSGYSGVVLTGDLLHD